MTNIHEPLPCFHCGLPCSLPPLLKDEHPFCCQGCLMVYEILKENSLHQYYDLQKHPGQKVEREEVPSEYDFLNDPELQNKIFDFQEKDFARLTLMIPAIHCAACIWLLENFYRLHHGIKSSRVNFLKKELQITFFKTETSLARIVETLSRLGYPPRLHLDSLSQKKKEISPHQDLIRLGVAGFCFGNVMLFSFPEYLAGKELPLSFQKFFAVLSFFLSLPVLFYSGLSWFQNAIASLRHRFLSLDVPIALGLLALFFRSSYEIFTSSGPGYFDSLCAFVFFLLLGKFFQKKSFENLSFERDYTAYFPLSVQREKPDGGGKTESLPLEKLEVGDIIVVRNQELVAADCLLISPQATLDYSFITGEWEPLVKKEKEIVLAGGKILGSSARLKVEKKSTQSFLIGLWNSTERKERIQNPSLSDRISPYFTKVVMGIALLSAFFWAFWEQDWGRGLYAFSSLLIVACPCALALSIPFTQGAMVRILGNHGIFLKSGNALERFATLDTLVFDKTGTLTQPGAVLEPLWEKMSPEDLSRAINLARQSVHPISKVFSERGKEREILPCEEVQETPGKGMEGRIDGVKVVLGRMDWVKEKISSVFPDSLPEGQFAFAVEGKICGVYNIQSKYRKHWKEILGELKKDYHIHLLSGDTDRERPFLEASFSSPSMVHFHLSPPEKAEYIQRLQKEGHLVAMIGDGLNDAGALLQSDCALVVLEDTSHFTPASHGILLGSRFHLLPRLFEMSRASVKIIKLNFILSLFYNTVGMAFAVSGHLSPLVAAILMPLSSLSVILLAILGSRWASRNM